MKTCPCCGGKTKLSTSRGLSFVHCLGCGLSTNSQPTDTKAIERWDKRVPTAPVEALLPKEPQTLKQAVERAINQFSAENGSDTPDFILAEYLMGCLAGFDAAVSARERWYGRVKGMLNNLPGNEKPAEDAPRPALIGDPKAG